MELRVSETRIQDFEYPSILPIPSSEPVLSRRDGVVLLPRRDRAAEAEKPDLVPHVLPVLCGTHFYQYGLDLELRTPSERVVGSLA